MKIFYSIILVLILACRSGQNQSPTLDQKQFEFQLIDNLGTVSIAFPERMDTFFTWIQESDCGRPCERGDYRFQSKRNRVFKESGFYWIGEPEDSVDQLSIYHQRPDTLLRNNESEIIQARQHLREKLLSDPETVDLVSDTIAKIGDRHFCIFGVAGISGRTGAHYRRMIAFTTISGTMLEFHYRLLTRKNDTVVTRFFEGSMSNLRTVEVKDAVIQSSVRPKNYSLQ